MVKMGPQQLKDLLIQSPLSALKSWGCLRCHIATMHWVRVKAHLSWFWEIIIDSNKTLTYLLLYEQCFLCCVL